MPLIDSTTPDRVVLAAVLWGEARGGGPAAMGDVACVVLNRLAAGWQDTVAKVCLAPWQFSALNPGQPPRAWVTAIPMADRGFVSALQVADDALAGKLIDRTGGADSYFAVSIRAPYWAKPPARHTYTIWLHSFWQVRPTPTHAANVVNVSAHLADPPPLAMPPVALTDRELDAVRTEQLNDGELLRVGSTT